MGKTTSLIRGNSLYIPLADESVQMCVTSPPYWSLRDYGIEGQLGLEETPDCRLHGLVRLKRNLTEDQRQRVALWLLGEELRDV